MGTSESEVKTFRLHWLDGTIEEIVGPTIGVAMNSAGIGGGAIRALDYWEEWKPEERK